MKSSAALAILSTVLVVLLVSGCTVSPTPVNTPDNTPTLSPTDLPWTFIVGATGGAGINVTSDPVYLDSGLAIFSCMDLGEPFVDQYYVYLADSNGSKVALAAQGLSRSMTYRAVNVMVSGNYTFDVTAAGSWAVLYAQPRYTSALRAPLKLSGQGTNVSLPFTLEKGPVNFTASNAHSLGRYFGVFLLDASGSAVAVLASNDSNAEVSKIIDVPRKGIYLLNVTADGDWYVDITPLAQ